MAVRTKQTSRKRANRVVGGLPSEGIQVTETGFRKDADDQVVLHELRSGGGIEVCRNGSLCSNYLAHTAAVEDGRLPRCEHDGGSSPAAGRAGQTVVQAAASQACEFPNYLARSVNAKWHQIRTVVRALSSPVMRRRR